MRGGRRRRGAAGSLTSPRHFTRRSRSAHHRRILRKLGIAPDSESPVLPPVLLFTAMAQREKRSVSLPPRLAREIQEAAAREETSFSGWLADTAAHRLRLDAGRRGIAEWERGHGPLTPAELGDGLARARALLARTSGGKRSRRSA